MIYDNVGGNHIYSASIKFFFFFTEHVNKKNFFFWIKNCPIADESTACKQ